MYRILFSIVSHNNLNESLNLISEIKKRTLDLDYLIILRSNIPESLSIDFPSDNVIHICNSHPLGFAENHNLNFKYSTNFDYFMILNPDIVFFEDWNFFDLISRSDQESLDIFSPILCNSICDIHGVNNLRYFTDVFLLSRFFKRINPLNKSNIISKKCWLSGALICFTKSSYKALKGFNEKYFLYCEDVDLFLRAHNNSMRIGLISDFKAAHKGRFSSHSNLKFFILHCCSLLKLHTSLLFYINLINSIDE